MTRDEAIALLKSGSTVEWNQWRTSNEEVPNLSGADLSRAKLIWANLRKADLSGANLYWANFSGADLSGANLGRANLSGAYFSEANLSGANLSGADLSGANLIGANLSGAYLSGAYLSGANLSGADLSEADLSSADLSGADLSGANLSRADLIRANLSGAKLSGVKNLPSIVAARMVIVPEGSIIGWKKCKSDVIVKLQIPQEARRSNTTSRKCRAEYVNVLEVFGGEFGISIYSSEVFYKKGETVHCDQWDENRWVECGGGIHFYLTREEAENHV